MSVSVATDRLLTDLYLSGDKAPILVSNQRSNCVRVYADNSTNNTDQEQHATNFIYGSNASTFYPNTGQTSVTFRHPRGNTTSLPIVSSAAAKTPNPEKSGSCFPVNKTCSQPQIKGLSSHHDLPSAETESEGLFPLAHQTSSLVTITNCEPLSQSLNFGSLGRDPAYISAVDSPEGEAIIDIIIPPESSSSSGSRKENLTPRPPTDMKKKKVKRKNRKVINSKQRKSVTSRKSLPVSKSLILPEKNHCVDLTPSTAPALLQRPTKTNSTKIVYQHSRKPPSTAQSTPNFPQTLAQRQEVCQAIYSRQGRTLACRSRTLPTVPSYKAVRSHSVDISSASIDTQQDVVHFRLSDVEDSEATVNNESTITTQRLGRLIKIYLSEKQSGCVRDVLEGTEYPCAPPATPTPDQLLRYSYVPSMNDVKAQRAFKNKLQVLEKAEQKKAEKQRGKREKAELQVLRDNTKVLKQRQRQEIYALNQVMTDLEYNRFVTFCLSNDIDPN